MYGYKVKGLNRVVCGLLVVVVFVDDGECSDSDGCDHEREGA